MVKRKIIKIDNDKCNGCGECIPNCPEGALQIIDGKARLISDLFCDGLGACIGECPEGAIEVEERDAQKYDEEKVMENISKQGENTILAHLKHLKDHNETGYYNEAVEYLKKNKIPVPVEKADEPKKIGCESREAVSGSCPGSQIMDLSGENSVNSPDNASPQKFSAARQESALRQWPVQINLIPPQASFLENADLLIAADCVPFSYPDFHQDFLKGKILMIGCPKFDDKQSYFEKLTEIFTMHEIKSVTVAHMEVPCCFALPNLVKQAIASSGKIIPFAQINISIKGKII
ncbi:MAG: 4Fe-4S binding protein [Actinobacteria bacterium]|nr:4Fe-4S binding protein [Actinomycetota bacterium]